MVRDMVLDEIEDKVDHENRTIISFIIVGPVQEEQNCITGRKNIIFHSSLSFSHTLLFTLQQICCLIISIVQVVSRGTVACSL